MLAIALLMALGQADAGAGPAANSVFLGVGMQKVLNAPGVTGLGVGDESIAGAKVLGKTQVLIVGKQMGSTPLLVLAGPKKTRYELVVREKQICGIDEIGSLLKPGPALFVKFTGDRIYLEGRFTTTDELDRAALILGLYSQVKCLAKIDPALEADALRRIGLELVRQGIKLQLVEVGEDVVLEGAVLEESDRNKGNAIVDEIYGPFRRARKAIRAGFPARSPEGNEPKAAKPAR